MQRITCLILIICLSIASGTALADKKAKKQHKGTQPVSASGLSADARAELQAAGVDKYLGMSQSTKSDYGVWTKHDFSSADDGPICIAGTDYSVFTRKGNPKKLLIFLQGGGACWQGFYNCNVPAESQYPPPIGPYPGVFDPNMADNPFADYSVVYMPYCDGSAFGGDNDVDDPAWQAFIAAELGLPPEFGPPTRYHRGLRNVSAGMDVAGEMFPKAKQITVMGHSAGGVGVAAFAPFLTRFVFGNQPKLTVYNDAGPIAVNLGTGTPPFACQDLSCFSVVARALDWDFQQFYPQSCIADGRCNLFGQQTGIIHWRLENDSTIREAFYETDSDQTNRFFAQGDGTLMDPEAYRELILTEHGALHDAYPRRYKSFIVSGDDSHGAVQRPFLFYTQEANGTFLTRWATEFVRIGQRQSKFGWKNIVEDYVPAPLPLPPTP